MEFTEKDIKLLKKALKHPIPCYGCDKQKCYMPACAACDERQQWDYKFKRPLYDRGLYQLYYLLSKLDRNKKHHNEIVVDIINELGADNMCWIRDILGMV